jgi:hypothetical protein
MKIRPFNDLYIIAFFSICLAGVILPPDNLENWEILKDDKIWIGWERSGEFDWCRAKSTLEAPISDIRRIIEDKVNYPDIFKRIETTKMITDEIVYIALDMPFPFAGRDYVVKYIQEKVDDEFIYRFYAIIHPEAPLYSKYVRLIHASGGWRLKSLDSTKTEITYTWNGELLGDFPNWALTRAWKQQGMEVMTWLEEAVEK